MPQSLMIVGTASHSGKSVLVTALCRILREDGRRVAPFKAQNMSLNSYVCTDGAEIGRAQVAQAEAAGLEPESDMNPILLKPTTDRRIQVVLNGRVYGTMSAREYYAEKPFFFEKVLESYQRLRQRYDVIVIEGAGSAAEVNLRDRDIVNLPFARAVESPAVLVADIDRGGVFASVVGTFELLDARESELLRGFVINKFRGDPVLFEDGRQFLEGRTERPCFGILPFIDNLRVDQEDSVALDEYSSGRAQFRVAVIRLPHISNYTDFHPLEAIEGMSVEYFLEPPSTFPHLLIIPGTKNTIGDLQWLRRQGFDVFLGRALKHGTFILGICGGFQMLGRRIADAHGVEAGGTSEGLGFLPVETELETNKVTVRSKGTSFLGLPIEGYEIHMGRTAVPEGERPFCHTDAGRSDGVVRAGIAGTYFHGLFENAEFTRRFVSEIAEAQRLDWRPSSTTFSKESEYARLAGIIRSNLDVSAMYELMFTTKAQGRTT